MAINYEDKNSVDMVNTAVERRNNGGYTPPSGGDMAKYNFTTDNEATKFYDFLKEKKVFRYDKKPLTGNIVHLSKNEESELNRICNVVYGVNLPDPSEPRVGANPVPASASNSNRGERGDKKMSADNPPPYTPSKPLTVTRISKRPVPQSNKPTDVDLSGAFNNPNAPPPDIKGKKEIPAGFYKCKATLNSDDANMVTLTFDSQDEARKSSQYIIRNRRKLEKLLGAFDFVAGQDTTITQQRGGKFSFEINKKAIDELIVLNKLQDLIKFPAARLRL